MDSEKRPEKRKRELDEEASSNHQVKKQKCFDEDLLEQFRCPISKHVFYDPVVAQDGQIYERDCIEEWFKSNHTSPMTRERIDKKLVPIIPIKQMINETINQEPKLKELQYNVKREYYPHHDDVVNIIRRKLFDKLLRYENFMLTDVASDKFLIQRLVEYKCPNDMMEYVIKNSIDLQCPLEKTNNKRVKEQQQFDTPVTYLFHNGKLGTLLFLIEELDINLFHRDSEGKSLVYILVERVKSNTVLEGATLECMEKILKIMFERGCDPDFNNDDVDIRTTALSSKNLILIETLSNLGVDFSNFLIEAILDSTEEVVLKLNDLGFRINVKVFGKTPSEYACKNSSLELIKLLKEKESGITEWINLEWEAQYNDNKTAIDYIFESKKLENNEKMQVLKLMGLV